VHLLLARAQAHLGRFEASLASVREAQRLDPTARIAEPELEAARAFAREQAATPTPGDEPPGWDPFLGGTWREEDGVIAARGLGRGEFDLTLLVAPETPSGASHAVSVELSLLSGQPGPYAGVLLGGRDQDDFLVAYVFHDPGYARQAIPEADLAAWRSDHGGAWPKFIRVCVMRGMRWDHVDTQVVHFADEGWVRLEVQVDGDRLDIAVDGARVQPVRSPRSLDGRVGLAKWYDTVAQFRGWRLDAGR
jgi:hypothetical protein